MFRFSVQVACMLALTSISQAKVPDISNLSNCIQEVKNSNAQNAEVLTFDLYKKDYQKLITDLQSASAVLPYVYQDAAANPLIQYLQSMGEALYLQTFAANPYDEQFGFLQNIISDTALALLGNTGSMVLGVQAFQEVVSDIYDGFNSEATQIGKKFGNPVSAPTYGVIPPLVKYGRADLGPYTWTAETTLRALGLKCAIVSLPPSQINGGLLSWCSLGHETGGHDVIHAHSGLLDELSQKVYQTVYDKFNSGPLANYWARCIDEVTADVCGCLNIGPSFGIALMGYFRSSGNDKLSTIGYKEGPHPIELLRGYLAAAVTKKLHFEEAASWSQVIANEVKRDNDALYLYDPQAKSFSQFPVPFEVAVASTEIVAQTILRANLSALQGHSLQGLVDWRDADQTKVEELVASLSEDGVLPKNLRGSGYYASYVVAAAIQAALQQGADIPNLFAEMKVFLSEMHMANPTWSVDASKQSIALLEKAASQ